jgi:Flp pilus assembly protein CpaB
MSNKKKIIIGVVCALVVLVPAVVIGVTVCGTSSMNSKVEEQAKMFEQQKADLDAKSKTTGPVVCAARAIFAGQLIGKDDMNVRIQPLSTIPAAAMTTTDAVIGKRARAPISKGQMFMQEDLMLNRATAK